MALVITSLSVYAQQPANSRNPYDNAGRIHNQLVEEYLRRHPSGHPGINDVAAAMQAIANNNAEYRSLNETPINARAIETGAPDIKNNFRNVVSSVKVAASAKTEIQSLIDHMFTIADGTSGYAEFHRYILAYEDRVLANRTFSEQDKKVILSVSSVARYSTSLWSRTLPATQEAAQSRRWFHWVIIGAADAIGTVAGGGVNVGTGAAASGAAYTMTNPDGK